MRIGLVDRESRHHGGGYERRDEESRSVPAIILDRLQPGRKRPPFVSQTPLQRGVGIKERAEGNARFGITHFQISVLFLLMEEGRGGGVLCLTTK